MTKLYFNAEDRDKMLKYYRTIPVDGNGNETSVIYDSHGVRDDAIKLLADISSLITTIESQKEEIEKAVAEIKFQVERNDKQREAYFATEKLYFDQKAITELAVKGLKEIACLNVDSAYSAGTFARNTLSEIEKLKNE